MIVKKPYGFLIKHFRLIHLLLLIPMMYVAFKFGDISSFFVDYVRSRYTTSEITIAGSYITYFTYLILFFLIIANGIIYFLMQSKKKSNKLYLISLFYYIFLVISTLIFYSTMSSIETGTSSPVVVNFVRDLSKICFYPCYFLMVLTIIKGIGFNFKTFRLDNNLDLQVTDEDEEEIEIKLRASSNSFKKRLIHFVREMKYYFLENKFALTTIFVIVSLLLFVSLYLQFEVYNKKYSVNQAFALDTFTMTLKDSYLTDVDYSGEKIDDNVYFLAVKVQIFNKNVADLNNKDTGAVKIDKSNFRIFLDDEILYPNYARSGRFIDIGNKYEGENIYAQTSDDYVFVYELSSEQIQKQYQLKILSGLQSKPGELVPSYKIINIRPKDLLKQESIGNVNIGSEINLDSTLLGKTTYKLDKFELTNSYNYEYKQCIQVSNCSMMQNSIVASQGTTLVVIKDDINWDSNSSYYKNTYHDIYADFGYISYTYTTYNGNKKNYDTRMKSVTPSGVTGVKIYEVPNMVLRGDDIKVIFKIRNQLVTINI